jgi:hypothetical protein
MTDEDGSGDNRYGFARRADVDDDPPPPDDTPRLEGWQRPDGPGAGMLGHDINGLMSDGDDNGQKLWFALGLAALVYLVGIVSSWSFYMRLGLAW